MERNNMISLDLMEFVEQHILPRYAAFDSAHNIARVMQVIRSTDLLSTRMCADRDMAYVVAAYHDLGMEGPRAIHHMTSGRILRADRRLRRWFSEQQIEVMAQAVEDHRASASRAPRNLYGKIIAEAVRDLRPATVLSAAVAAIVRHNPHLDRNACLQRFMQHVRQKYASGGNIHVWIPGSENETHLATLRRIIADDAQLTTWFDRYYTAAEGS